jgi:hypothetical protein
VHLPRALRPANGVLVWLIRSVPDDAVLRGTAEMRRDPDAASCATKN